MSTINGLFGNSYNIGQTSQTLSAAQSGTVAIDGDSDASASNGAAKANSFRSAILQALAQIGIVPPTTSASDIDATPSATTSATNGTSASTEDPQQALQTFMQTLFAALQAQGGDASSSGDGSDAGSSPGAAKHGHHHHHGGGGMAKLQGDLQNLIQQLATGDSSDSSDSSTSTSSASGTTGATATSSSTSALQQDFQNLLNAVGVPSNQASLSDFLKNISNTLQTNGSSAGVIASA